MEHFIQSLAVELAKAEELTVRVKQLNHKNDILIASLQKRLNSQESIYEISDNSFYLTRVAH